MRNIKKSNIVLLIIITVLIIPQTRKSIQVFLHKGIGLLSSVKVIAENERQELITYNWLLRNENGVEVNFNNYRNKVVLVNFWATWCPPCIAEMPSFQKLYEHNNKNIEFLFVTTDAVEKIKKFKLENGYTFPVYQIISDPIDQFETTSIPRTVVIDKSGKIIIDKGGVADWFSDSIQGELGNLVD
ncbi:MAG: TlpA family protein disulfide reductase [Psychroserpens sp.]|nr:TlpA family protein disulfide reductase [Psychroserpens sp.]